MDTLGKHLLVEYWNCDNAVLNDIAQIETLMNEAAVVAGATVVTSTFHRFQPQGVSGVVVVEESHLSIHTWPETGYAAVDFYTCGECLPQRAHEYLFEKLGAQRTEHIFVKRGAHVPKQIQDETPSMQVVTHAQTSTSQDDKVFEQSSRQTATRKVTSHRYSSELTI